MDILTFLNLNRLNHLLQIRINRRSTFRNGDKLLQCFLLLNLFEYRWLFTKLFFEQRYIVQFRQLTIVVVELLSLHLW